MVARPPTSAVDGRNVSPARRTAGLLFIPADSTRALRPTVFTAAVKFARADVSAVCDTSARDALPVRIVVLAPRAVVPVVVVELPKSKTRAHTRTVSDFVAAFVVAARFTTLRVTFDASDSLAFDDADGTWVTVDGNVAVARDGLPRDTFVAVLRDVCPVPDDALSVGITRDIDVPSAKANGAENAIKKKHRGNLLIIY